MGVISQNGPTGGAAFRADHPIVGTFLALRVSARHHQDLAVKLHIAGAKRKGLKDVLRNAARVDAFGDGDFCCRLQPAPHWFQLHIATTKRAGTGDFTRQV
jgi:hypothetical protein